MANLDSLDLKLVLSFANAYRRLNEKGEISDQQLEEVMQLVENYQNYAQAEFKARLQKIFPDAVSYDLKVEPSPCDQIRRSPPVGINFLCFPAISPSLLINNKLLNKIKDKLAKKVPKKYIQ